MDESTVNLEFPIRACWMKRGQQKRLDAPSGPQGFYHIFGALNWRTDAVTTQFAVVKNSATFIAFVEHLMVQTFPQQTVVMVMDNAPYHRSAAVRAALSLFQHRLFVFWLPPYCPTLNPIERFWRHLKDLATANCLFRDSQALLANLQRVLDAQNIPEHPLRLSFSKFFS